MKTYELKKIEIEGVDACFVKYAQMKHIQATHHKGLEIATRNGITSLCKLHKSKTGFTPKEFTEITNKVIGECPPFGVMNGKMHTSLHYSIFNRKNQIDLVTELVEHSSQVIITNCDNWHDGYCKMQYDQIKKATKAIQQMSEKNIYEITTTN